MPKKAKAPRGKKIKKLASELVGIIEETPDEISLEVKKMSNLSPKGKKRRTK